MTLPRPLADPEARDAFNRATRWLRLLARVGYVSKGVVYIVMGLLAARAAIRVSGDVASFRGAMLRIVDKPFGHTMLGVLMIGFAGYASWQVLSALLDAEDSGTGRKAITSRVEQLATGLAYAALAKAAGHVLRHDASRPDEIEYHWAAVVANVPAGHLLLFLAGSCVVGYGCYQVWRARSERSLLKKVLLPPLRPAARQAIVAMGRFGLASRGLVFGVLGWLIAVAGLREETSIASNLADALRVLGQGAAGRWLLAVVAVGLVAHGGYQFVNARYRRLRERRTWPFPRRRGSRREDRRAPKPNAAVPT